MDLIYSGIWLIVWPILVDSFQLLSSPEVTDLVQLGAIPDGKRDDICSKVHEINWNKLSTVADRV